MKCLVIDGTQDELVVEVIADERIFGGFFAEDRKEHSEIIDVAIEGVLKRAELNVADLDCIACCVGAGSFTGIRVGIATVLGLNFPYGKKLISFNSFEVLAYNDKGYRDCVVFGKGAVFAAEYDKLDQLKPPEQVDEEYVNGLESYSCYGEGFDRLSAIASVVRDKYDKGMFSQKLSPMYLQQSQAEKERERKLMREREREHVLCSIEEVNLSEDNAEELAALELKCFGKEAWSESMIRGEFMYSNSVGLAYRIDGRAIAYGIIETVLDEAHISTCGVIPEYRGLGVGSMLVGTLIEMARDNGATAALLEVKADNYAAITLYKKLGFRSFGLRKHYYPDRKDALLMRCALK
ncbi:MAG: ribosomal protein S18-alanine N-acetyltransferase [Clostridia bacterium]|nr:ribosomal protein S18-alanine N-acetyltransferase [Clostridia bacterium]